jgi:hypothetical protein
MSYLHLNRLIAHSEKLDLTPAERLVSWYLAYEARNKTNAFSKATSTLSKTLKVDRRTIQRSLAYLVDIDLFERIKAEGNTKQADTYRLKLSCPLNCENLEIHNTASELAAIENSLKLALTENTPETRHAPLNDINVAVNDINVAHIKNKEEEEDVLSSELVKSKVLGLIKTTLKQLKTKTEDHFTLQGFITLRPEEILKAALELFETKKLDNWRRQEPYLRTTIQNSPKNLLSYAEDLTLIEASLDNFESTYEALTAKRDLIRKELSETDFDSDKAPALKENLLAIEAEIRTYTSTNPEAKTAEKSYVIGSTPERVYSFWLTTLSGYLGQGGKTSEGTWLMEYELLESLIKKFSIASKFLDASAARGTLSEGVIYGTYEALEILQVAFQFAGLEDNFEFSMDSYGDLAIQFGYNSKNLGTLEVLLTEEEKAVLQARQEAIQEAKLQFREENNIQGEHTPAKFFQSEIYKTTDQRHPEPLTPESKQQRLKEFFQTITEQANDHFDKLSGEKQGETYSGYLKTIFTWQDDLAEFLEAYPKRPEGNQDFRKTATAFLKLRQSKTLAEIIDAANLYKTSLGDTYPKSAANWLDNQTSEAKALGGF